MTILDKIVAEKRKEVAENRLNITTSELEKQFGFSRQTLSFRNFLERSSSGIISEFKRKSPSKGWIHEKADVCKITSGYSNNGASAISILTDFPFFGGTSDDLKKARPNIEVPILRKDFIIDEYQLFEARAMGADVILLIAAILTPEEVKQLARRAHDLSLQILLEVHNEKEIGHACPDIDVIGVNNRNLKTFLTNTECSFELSDKIPAEFVKISESGLSAPETVKALRKTGYKGFLMGENFMKEKEPELALKRFIAEIENTK